MFRFVTRLPFFLLLFSVSSTSWIQKALPLSVLISTPYGGPNTWNISARQYLNVSHFYLVMQPDCNLVEYNDSTPFLTANLAQKDKNGPVGPAATRNCYSILQADGNFVVYQNLNATHKVALWATGTYSYGYNNSNYRYLMLGGDGRLGLYEPDGTALTLENPLIPVSASPAGAPSPAPATSQNATSNLAYPFPPELEWKPSMSIDGYPYMPREYFLSQGSNLRTMNGWFILKLGHHCKLQSQEIWKENNTVKRVIWDPQRNMSGVVSGNCELMLQQDGRLDIRDTVSGMVYWNSSVSGDDSVNWVLKVNADDGHVSVSDILNSTNVLWTSLGEEFRPESGTELSIWPIVVGVIGGVLIMAKAAFWLWFLCLRPRFLNPTDKAFQRRLLSIGGRSRVLSEAEIKQATNSFGFRIGYGGFGDVFYGKLEDGQEIAAKVLSSGSHQSKEEFCNEIELLSMVHYKYLVTLIGYSFTPQHQILIYEYMSGGDLRHRLSQGSGNAGNVCAGTSVAESPLTWRQRTNITLQVAEGIEYLHDKCCPAIIHRDIKSNNILLTNELVAKVADFGLSKLRTIDQENATHITTVVKGTPGYLDPEYQKTGLLTEKSDVYAFGIVLMEILTGQQQMHIAERVFEARRSGTFEILVDPHLEGDYDRDEFVNLVDLSLWCVRKNSCNRPFMRQVVQRLREIVVAPLESSAQPKVIDSKDGHNNVIELENSEEVMSNDTVPFSGFSTGNIKSGTWRLDQFGDSCLSQMLDHSSSQSSAGNPDISL